MDPAKDLTLHAIRQLHSSHVVFVLTGDFQHAHRVLCDCGIKAHAIDLMPLYKDGDVDEDNYRRIARRILEECSVQNTVAVLVNGHPLVGVSWWERLHSEPAMGNIKIDFVEGMSSVLSVFTLLRRDPIEKGVTVVDVNRLLLFRYEVPVELDMLILDICSVGTRHTFLSDPSKCSRWDILCHYLTTRYPADHICYLLFVAMNSLMKSNITPIAVSEMPSALVNIRFGTTLFVPGLSPTCISVEFLRSLLGLPYTDSALIYNPNNGHV